MTLDRPKVGPRQRLVLAIVCSIVVLAALVLLPAEQAVASESTYICTSTTFSCDSTGYQGQQTWHWFVGPHNCTNYVAWRETQNGVAAPSWNPGSAGSWAVNAQGHVPIDHTPAVGAVAQWSAGAGDAGWSTPSGHVAYVQDVQPGYIVVAEDNYPSGPLDIRMITPGPEWPSNFIHFKDLTVTGRLTFNGTWLLRNTTSPGSPDIDVSYGGSRDVPVVGSWTGTGTDTIGVFRPASAPGQQAQWLLRTSLSGGSPNISFYYGGYGDIPVVGDWDGNGTDTIGVFRPASAPGQQAQWLLRNSVTPGSPNLSFYYGGYGDIPVVGRNSIGVFRPAAAEGGQDQWLLRDSVGPGSPDNTFYYGGYKDIPILGNWNSASTTTSIGVGR